MTDDFMAKMYTPPNPALSDYDDLIEYALTIEGLIYEYAAKVWGLDDNADHWAKVQSFKKRGRWQGSFEDLRCCLFAYQRSIRWSECGAYDREGRREFTKIYRALCRAWGKRAVSFRYCVEENRTDSGRLIFIVQILKSLYEVTIKDVDRYEIELLWQSNKDSGEAAWKSFRDVRQHEMR